MRIKLTNSIGVSIIVLGFILCVCCDSFAADWYTKRNGDWNVPSGTASSPWYDGGSQTALNTYPGVGDKVLNGDYLGKPSYVLTIPSGFNAEIGVVSGAQYAIGVSNYNSGGSLVINGSLLSHGDIVQRGGTSLYLHGSLTLRSEVTSVYRMLRTVSGGSGAITIDITGTPGAYAELKGESAGSGINGVFWQLDNDTTNINIDYAKFTNLGNTTYRAVSLDIGTGNTFIGKHLIVNDCSDLLVNLIDGTSTVDLDAIDFRGPTKSTAYTISGSSAKTTGTRKINNITIYSGSIDSNGYLQARDLTATNLYGYNGGITNGTATTALDLSVSNLFIVSDVGGAAGFAANSGSELSNAVLLSSQDNKHYCVENLYSASYGANSYTDIVFDGAGAATQTNDGILIGGPVTITRAISINEGGIIANAIATSSETTILNCTVVGNSNGTNMDAALLSVGENYGSATQAKICKNNLMYGTVESVFQMNQFVQQTNFTLDYNGSYDNGFAANLNYPVGHKYAGTNSYFSAGINSQWWNPAQTFGTNNATHDIYADPQFVDATVTVMGYLGSADMVSAGREIVKINGVDYQGNITTATTKNVAGALAYIRSGLTPTNKIYETSGDGTYIGAVEPQINSGWPLQYWMLALH